VNRLRAPGPCGLRLQATAGASGVTLLELLVVIAVFSIMSAAAYSSLQSSLKAEQHFDAAMNELAAVQMSLALFQRDVMQLSPRPVRDAFGDSEPALVLRNGRELVLTRGGNFSSLRLDQAELTRVAWSWRDEQLVRSHWRRLDTAQGDRPLTAPLLSKVSNLHIRVLDQSNIWRLDWPLAAGGKIRAVEITLELEGWGEIRRLLPTPG
jgi:general secretion pathway protein J